MRWGNCLVYAFTRLWRDGGYVCLSKSRYGPWLHAEWSADLKTFYAFNPTGPKRRRRFPPLVFRGRVTRRTRSC